MSTKKHIISGKKFYIKFFQPGDVKLSTHNRNINNIEICISHETWKELQNKIKHFKEEDI